MSAAVRARSRLLVAAAVCALVLAAAIGSERAAGAPQFARANVVLIQTDDMTLRQLDRTYRLPDGSRMEVMPVVRNQIARAGLRFTRYYVSDPLCCPSRATLLTGQYAHNNGVLGNKPPRGGHPALPHRHTVAKWLQSAGYRTIHIGKYLNYYGEPPYSQPDEVPPGWTDWRTLTGEDSTHLFYGYRLNRNGDVSAPYGDPTYEQKDSPTCPEPPPLGRCNFQNDVLSAEAVDAISDVPSGRPFFLSLDYVAPHGDSRPPIGPEPAPRHYGMFAGAPSPRPPGWNERNVGDKPSFVRQTPLLTPQEVRRGQREWEKSLESLRSVDDGVAAILDELRRRGALRRTYVIFTSDNGFFFGEHRFSRAKFLPYEPANHVPFVIRGPGIRAGTRSGELVANVDIAPTLLQIARARATRRLDGRTMLPFAFNPRRRTRRPILLEAYTSSVDLHTARRAGASAQAPPRDYNGVRLGRYKYIVHDTQEKELYDLVRDPNEQRSLHRVRRFYPVRNFLAGVLEDLTRCRGRGCKRIVRERVPPPRR